MLSEQALQVFIDQLYCEGMTLVLSGWAIPPCPITRIDLLLGSQVTLNLQTFGLPSEDVAAIYGPRAKNVRFFERILLPEDFLPSFFSQAALIMTTTSGLSLRHSINAIAASKSRSNCFAAPEIRLGNLRLGIGITTLNRSSILAKTIESVVSNTCFSYSMIVADDGSSDDTFDILRQKGVGFISGNNRGVAWNKNRALFFLLNVKKCDVVILLEDDTFPIQVGWESHWIISAMLYGHCNYCPPWFGTASNGGFGQWFDPFDFRGKVSGQCSAFSSEALNWVGYLDSRFGRYGFEHAEHSMRMVRGGYGGWRSGNGSLDYNYYLIKGGLAVADSISSASEESIKQNAAVLHAVQGEGIFRPAWRTDEELQVLRSEIQAITAS